MGNGEDTSKGGSPGSDNSGDTFSATANPILDELQKGLPDEIKNKTYPSPPPSRAADEELWTDLKNHSLQDSDSKIKINQQGKAIWSIATAYHQNVVQRLLKMINNCSEEEDLLLAQTEIPLIVDKKTNRASSRMWLFGGPKRVEADDGVTDPKFIEIAGFSRPNSMNPHVIIEFSWTHQIDVEIGKLREQMKKHIKELGVVKLGFLIKAIPVKGNDYPSYANPELPLCGFDVYRFSVAEEATLSQSCPEPLLKCRHGTEEAATMAIEISGADLDRNNEENGMNIPLSAVRRALEKNAVVFQPEATG